MTEEEVGNLIVRLTGDGSSFQKMLTDAEKQAENSAKQLQSIGQRIEGMQKSLGGFASAAVSALASIGAGGILKSAFNSYVQLEQGQLKLNAAIEANGGSVDQLVPKYQAFASTLADLTNHTKGETLSLIRQAEMRGISGDAAQKLVQQSIALASAVDGEASSILVALNAAKDGNVEMLQRQLRLRGIKDQTELNERVNKLMTAGWKTAQAEGASLGGQLTKLQNSYEGIKKQLGPIVAEYIRPFIGGVKQLVDVFKNLDDGSKRLAVGILAGVAGFFMLGPALAAIKTAGLVVFSPIIIGVNALVVALGALASPIGLLVLGIAAIGAELLVLSGQGPAIFASLKQGFAAMIQDWLGSWESIKAAVSAGDLQLAIQIGWTQIQVSFIEATSTIYKGWVELVYRIKSLWAEFVGNHQSGWEVIKRNHDRGMLELQRMLGNLTQEQVDQLNKIRDERSNAVIGQIKDAQAAAEKAAQDGAIKSLVEANKKLADLKAQLADQQEAALWEKFFNDFAPGANEPLNELSVNISKSMKKGADDGKKHLDAALTGSAEALSRMAAYGDLLNEIANGKGGKGKAGQAGRAGAAAAAAAGKVDIGAPPIDPAAGQAGFGGGAFIQPILDVGNAMQAIIAQGKQLMAEEAADADFKARGRIGKVDNRDGAADRERRQQQIDQWLAAGGDPKMVELLKAIEANTKKQVEKKPDIDLAAAQLEEV